MGSKAKVIHIDEALSIIKSNVLVRKLLLKSGNQKKSDENENFGNVNFAKPGVKVFISKSKFLSNLKFKIIRLLLKEIIEKEINKNQYEYLIIEGTQLEDVFKEYEFDFSLMVDRTDKKRHNGVLERDGKKGINMDDIKARDDEFNGRKNRFNDIVEIKNEGDKDNLRGIAREMAEIIPELISSRKKLNYSGENIEITK